MVSFEIFGLNGNKAVKMESRIFDQFRGDKCVKDMVVIIHNSTARNAQMIDQPFIRVCGSSNRLSASKIRERLTPLGLKLQQVALSQVR